MTSECCTSAPAAPAPAPTPAAASRVARAARWLVGPGLVLMLAPKCPLCLAGYLSVFGAGAAAAVAPWLRPVAVVLLVASAIAIGVVWHRDGRQRLRAGRSSG